MRRPLRASASFAAFLGLTMIGAACASSGRPAEGLDFRVVRPPGQLAGRWVGGTDVLGGYMLIEADFRGDGSLLSGELRAPSANVGALRITDVQQSADTVRFTIHSPYGAHRATGQWDGGIIVGRIEGAGLTGRLHLLPVHETPAAVARRRAGSYAEGRDHHLLLIRRAGGGLAWSETEPLDDGALWIAGGALYGYTADTMFTDRSIRAEPRRQEWAVFGDDSIRWRPETRPARTTHRLDAGVRQQEVTFTSNEATLAGTLLLPPSEGPHPAVVLVHGSGPTERSSLLGMARADMLLRNGLAVLLYDKRGVGGSSGAWEQASLDELANDAAAGVTFLRGHPSVRPDAVGLFGHSQAGWVIPAAAARQSGADYLIVLAGGGVTPQEQEVFRARAQASAASLSGDQAAELMEAKWRYAAARDDWEQYRSRLRAADPRIVAVVEAPADSASANWTLVRQLARHDPLPDLRAIRVPTLVVFGAEDANVPVDAAATIWRDLVPSSLLTVEVIPGVGHALVEQRPGRSVFPAGLVRAIADWLDARAWSAVPR